MPRKAGSELELKWRDASLKVVGLPAIFIVATIAVAWLVLVNWEKVVG